MTAPASTSSTSIVTPRPNTGASPVSSTASAGPTSSAVSTVSPPSASIAATLRSSPYRPNETASVSDIHNAPPPETAITATPTAATATAITCTRPIRSPSTTMPSATLTSGLMK